jgi:hypothetical protein
MNIYIYIYILKKLGVPKSNYDSCPPLYNNYKLKSFKRL